MTACCLDLGDFPAPTSASDDYLLHVLSDQKWGLHWLLYIDRAGNEAMVVSSNPIGFVLDEDWEGRLGSRVAASSAILAPFLIGQRLQPHSTLPHRPDSSSTWRCVDP